LFEGGIRTPCIARWPGITRPGEVSDDLCWLPDWYTTITGKTTPDAIDLRPVLEGRKRLAGRHICWRFSDALVKTPLSYAIREGNRKLLRIGEDRFLFDLGTDPGENQNLYNRDTRIVAKLEEKLGACYE
jgi:arylsulfatase A